MEGWSLDGFRWPFRRSLARSSLSSGCIIFINEGSIYPAVLLLLSSPPFPRTYILVQVFNSFKNLIADCNRCAMHIESSFIWAEIQFLIWEWGDEKCSEQILVFAVLEICMCSMLLTQACHFEVGPLAELLFTLRINYVTVWLHCSAIEPPHTLRYEKNISQISRKICTAF